MLPQRMARIGIEKPGESLLRVIERVARAELGPNAPLGGDALALAVRRVSGAYTRQAGAPSELRADAATLAARLCFFLPRDWPKITAPLAELAAVSALPAAPVLRILDLGAGLGATGLAAARFGLTQAGYRQAIIDAVDREGRGLELARALGRELARTESLALELRPHALALDAALHASLDPPYQLIVLGFVLNELELGAGDPAAQHAQLLLRLAPLLAHDGAIIVLEPALRAHSRNLQRVRGFFAAEPGPLHVFAPCLHRSACPLLERERDWCHEQLPLELPAPLVPIARAAGLRTADLTYSYLTLHRAPRSLAERGSSNSLAERERERPLLRVVSSALRSKGKLELAVCGEGPTRKLRRLDRHASARNDAIERAQRGSIVRLAETSGDTNAVQEVGAETQVELAQQIEAT